MKLGPCHVVHQFVHVIHQLSLMVSSVPPPVSLSPSSGGVSGRSSGGEMSLHVGLQEVWMVFKCQPVIKC